MLNNKVITVIIPAHNEADIIEKTLKNLDPSWIDEVIVIDDGSTDQTREIVSLFPVDLIYLSRNAGKGNAVYQGIKASRGDILVIVDADLGESVSEIKKMVVPVANNEVEAAIGVVPIKGGGLGVVRKLADFAMYYLTGKKMKAPLSGQRVLKKEIIDKVLPLQNGYGLEMGLNVAFIKQGIRYLEVDCDFKHRVTGNNIIGYRHRFKQFVEIIRSILDIKRGNHV
ncbi:MAG: glycosyltransferase family 2 protein [bacterium]